MKMMGEMKPPTGADAGDGVPDFSQFADIFEGLGKELQKNLCEQKWKERIERFIFYNIYF